jgi:hypothetical protein
MISKVKSIIWNVSAFCFLIWFSFRAIGYALDAFEVEMPELCPTTTGKQFPSPTGEYIVFIEYRDCGAMTRRSAHIYIQHLEAQGEPKHLMLTYGDTERIRFEWSKDKVLIIANISLKELQSFQRRSASGVKIVLEAGAP